VAIPAFNEHGLLPEGIHDCTLEEVGARFGTFQASDRRSTLWAKFKEFMEDATACELVEAVLVDGSFVTAEIDPNDIDLILIVPEDHNFSADISMAEYNVVSRRRVHRRCGFDLLVARSDSEEYRRYLSFFQQVRFEPEKKKGILRIQR
jgi:hypothetical protein